MKCSTCFFSLRPDTDSHTLWLLHLHLYFVLNFFQVPSSYPFKAPSITFSTPIYHCNVSDGGRICLSMLQDQWNPALSIPKALEAVRMMLKTPDTDQVC